MKKAVDRAKENKAPPAGQSEKRRRDKFHESPIKIPLRCFVSLWFKNRKKQMV